MFHMAEASHHFRTGTELEDSGFYPVQGNRWKKESLLYVPMYQGRMIGHFDHRANSVRFNPESRHNPYLSESVSEEQHADPDFLPQTQYWVPASLVEKIHPPSKGWPIAYRRIARTTDFRTFIANVAPRAGFGDSIFLLGPECDMTTADVGLLVANLNSYCFDYVTRQKLQGTNLSWYIVEQLPVIAPADYGRAFGATTARDLVRDHVLRLTYTAHDIAPFARDLGYDGPPFIWNEEERCHLRARLDALYFHLYGLSRQDAAYILDTFPIVRRHDKAAFGHYRTKDMVLAYYNALAAGDTDVDVAV